MCKFRFDDKLLNHIEFGRNTEAKSMLTKELAKKADEFGTLLHRAAYYGNVEIIQHLIELGSDVDFLGEADRKTPLMVAVQKERLESVKVLLDAGANVDIADARGQSAPQMVFHSDYFDRQIIEEFVRKLQASTCDFYELAFKLLEYGCALHHAIILRDLHLVKFILERDLKLDYEGCNLEEKSGNVLEEEPTIIIIHLELESNPSIKRLTNPCGLDIHISKSTEQAGRFGEFLHQLQESGDFPTLGDDFFNWNLRYQLEDSLLFQRALNSFNSLIAHLVILEKCGTPILKTAECYKTVWEFGQWTEFEKYHDFCRKILNTTMFGTLTLFDLLIDKRDKMKKYVGNKIFVIRIEEACSKYQLSNLFPYYYKTLMTRISRADKIHQLEDTAIDVFSKIFDSNYNECYDFARKVISYLTEEELKRFCVLRD